MIKNFVKILELLGDRLEVCVSVFILLINVKIPTHFNIHEQNISHAKLS